MELALLLAASFLAGFIDAVVGGGGLILIPALLVLQPGLPVATALGTNKFAASFGTLIAAAQYARTVGIPWKTMLPAAGAGFVTSLAGARAVTLADGAVLRPLILGLLIAVALYTLARKDFGSIHAPRLGPAAQLLVGLGAGAVLGFYDGFFGPGTGSFLIFAFIGLMGFSFLAASASAKVVNLATNLAALAFFALAGHVSYRIAVPMAILNVAGSLLGSRLAMLKGSAFVRVLFLVVVSAVIARLGYDLWRG